MKPTRQLKYIITADYGVLLFDDGTQHGAFRDQNPGSAGFCTLEFDPESERYKATCYGKSVSLGLATHKHDATRIERAMNDPY